MPSILKLTLQLEKTASTGNHLAASTNAAILTLLSGKNPELANELHDAPVKPYSLALEPDAGFGGVQGRYLEVRLNVLHDALEPILTAALELGRFFGTTDDPLRGRLLNVETENESYPDFVTRALSTPVQRLTQLEFLSNTCLSGNGNNWALPIPGFVMNGLRIRFEKFSGFKLEGNLNQYTSRNLECKHYKVNSFFETISSKETQDGFVGKATFLSKGSDDSARAIALLLRFAEWSGVGVNTAFGCGQVRVKLETARVRDEGGEVLRVVRV